jgi:ubiquinone/menaquinone biosynthesis C-methylase UbiE
MAANDPKRTLGIQTNSLSILAETTKMVTTMDQDVSEDLVEAGRGYEDLFVPALFNAWTKHLVEGAKIQEGSHVLDVACGTGVLTRSALARAGANGRVVGADPAPGMLAAAKEIEPAIDWVLCSAESLEVDDGVFDCVISQFGMMFFEDRQKSAEEMFRALKPGGSLAIAVWRSVEHNPAYADIISVLEEHVGTAAADASRLPYSLGNADEVTAVLEGSGFSEISVEAKTETAKFPSSRQMVEAELRGWLPLFDIFLTEDKINEVLMESDKTLGKYAGPSGEAVFPTSAHVFTARKI